MCHRSIRYLSVCFSCGVVLCELTDKNETVHLLVRNFLVALFCCGALWPTAKCSSCIYTVYLESTPTGATVRQSEERRVCELVQR